MGVMRWEHLVGLLGLVLLIGGHYTGLFVAPPERMMGEVGRILYVHVPAAWLSLVTFTVAFFAALGYLITGRHGYDWAVEAACEVGVLMNALLLVLGSIFARPTWGVWWTWDPRLTSSAVMLITFVGVILLRSAVADPDRRATYSSVSTLLAYVNIPVTYMSVKWWRSLHQIQSSPDTVADTMVWVLRLNAVAFLFVTIWFIARRWRIARAAYMRQAPPPLPSEAS
jgi:heme exporter protein C